MDIEELIKIAKEMGFIIEEKQNVEDDIFDEYGNYKIDNRKKTESTLFSVYKK